jgi:hypothetical protein
MLSSGAGAAHQTDARAPRADREGTMRRSDQLGIIMANEPRAYREAIAATFRALRPGLAIAAVEPDELDGHLARLDGGLRWLVVHSRCGATMPAAVVAWALLYPGGEGHATVSGGGRQATIADVQLDDLLALLDRAAGPPAAGSAPTTAAGTSVRD